MSGSLIDGMHQEVIGLLKLYTPKVKNNGYSPYLFTYLIDLVFVLY